jgi:cytochrome c-type biogenesis protein
MVPGYVGLVSGYSAHELRTGDVELGRVTRTTGLFVLGFTVVFVLVFGAAATSIGQILAGPQFQVVSGVLVIVMGLFVAVTAVWTPPFLLPLLRERRLAVDPDRFGALTAPVMGAAFAFGWTPCIGPFLTAALALGAASDTVGRGMVVLTFYSLGLGIPFLVTAVAVAGAYRSFERLRPLAVPITVVSGLLLAGFGVLLVTGTVTELNSWFSRWLIRLGLEDLADV